MLSQEAVVHAAKQRADEIVRSAEHEAASRRADIQAWSAALFARIEQEVNRAASTVAQSKAALESQFSQEFRSPRSVPGVPSGPTDKE